MHDADNEINSTVAAVILAAGDARRFGGPKQLALIDGKPLIVKSIEAVTGSQIGEAVVVIGAYAAEITPVLQRTPRVHIARNLDWAEGKATSLRVGLHEALSLRPDATGVLFLVCDQPYVNSELVNEILDHHRTNPESNIASAYSETIGVPMLLPHWCFGEISALGGDEGAKTVAEAHANQVVPVAFPDGAVDVDAEEDMIGL